jgi:hypothetical protein
MPSEGFAEGLHDPIRMRAPHRSRGVIVETLRDRVEPAVEVLLTDLAQQRIGEVHGLVPDLAAHDPPAQLAAGDPKIDASHAFYLGYEFAKAVTALTLGKSYTQDQALRWGFLTVPEVSHRSTGVRGQEPGDREEAN